MNLKNFITTIDSHAAGEPLRTITSGIPYLRGNTMYEKMIFMKKNFDNIRILTMHEPRGYRDMLGAVLTEPINSSSDIGVFYIDTRGYAPMCGAGTLALCKTLVDTGMVKVKEPETHIYMDTPSGTIKATAIFKNGIAEKVKFQNIASFSYKKDLPLQIPDIGNIKIDITYGGNFFVMVNADRFGIDLNRENAKKFAELGMLILREANKKYSVTHPEKEEITFLNDIMFCKDPNEKNPNYRNLVIFGDAQIDRSPCGTGTCARMAKLYLEGKLKLNEEFIHESIIGTKFVGRIISEVKIGDITGIIPELEGECSITGFNNFILDKNDTIGNGFIL